jgi:hypothetical protein
MRELAEAVVAVAVTAAAVVSAAYGPQELAALLAGLVALTLILAVLRLRRRLDRHEKAMADRSQVMMERVELAQRQVLAAVENERVAAHDRYAELRDAVRGFGETLEQIERP